MVGDGSYLMMNSEIATSVMLGMKLTIVVLDNRGFGCINRLQRATGGESFNNLLRARPARDAAGDRFRRACREPRRDGREGREPRRARGGARAAPAGATRTSVIVIDTDPLASTEAGGHWWDVAVPEVSERAEVRSARARRTRRALKGQASWRLAIGANPIGWSNDDLRELGGATPLETCLAEAKEAGFEGMELGHKFPREAEGADARCSAASGSTLVSGWYSAELLRRARRRGDRGAAAASRSAQGDGLQRC